MRRFVVAVVGAARAPAEGCAAAEEVGRLLARAGAVLVCGGRGGVMEAAARGCLEEGGLTIGILPGGEAEEANPYVAVAIPTNMGHARNVIIAHAARAMIAVGGEFGTLSEMAIARKLGRPVIALGPCPDVPGVRHAATPEEAVRMALETEAR